MLTLYGISSVRTCNCNAIKINEIETDLNNIVTMATFHCRHNINTVVNGLSNL